LITSHDARLRRRFPAITARCVRSRSLFGIAGSQQRTHLLGQFGIAATMRVNQRCPLRLRGQESLIEESFYALEP
jgi:hypothetical protein